MRTSLVPEQRINPPPRGKPDFYPAAHSFWMIVTANGRGIRHLRTQDPLSER